jgi:hypothetical protein
VFAKFGGAKFVRYCATDSISMSSVVFK